VDKILTDTNDLGLSGKGMNPNAAKLYMEYLCSPEGQKLVADLGEVVLSPGVYPPIKDADKITANSSFMDNPSADEYKKPSGWIVITKDKANAIILWKKPSYKPIGSNNLPFTLVIYPVLKWPKSYVTTCVRSSI
jgi:ABC-type glycerol-3-phosphate transport system substrate-binding protein